MAALKRFAAVKVTDATQRLLNQDPKGDDLIRLNRSLLADAYPNAFPRDPGRSLADNTKKLAEIWRRAMEIWLPELPDIQLVQNIHRIPWNTTYWKNWPTEPHPYVNGAHWHLTFAMVLWSLQAA